MKAFSLFIILLSSLSLAGERPNLALGTPERSLRVQNISSNYKMELESQYLRQDTNVALDAMIRFAVYSLDYYGHTPESKELLKEWEGTYSHMLTSRGMTDHKPLSNWLAQKTMFLEVILGQELFHALRLDDLITVNYALPVCFGCEDHVSEAEYYDHFVKSIYGYRGLGQVIVYWGSLFSCVGFTWGTGFFWCDPIAMGVEWVSLDTWIPALNSPLWKLACNQ